jgi:membrane peptidoglycan carboxypeptidase
MPPRRTARPGGQAETAAQPRMTRAEMRRAAQQGGKRGRGAPSGGGGGPAGPPPRKRFIDYPRWGKSGVRRWLPSWKQVVSGFVICLGALTGMVGYAYATTPMPSWNPQGLTQNNIFYWDDGSTMATTGATNRQTIAQLSTIPTPVVDDFLAAENASFWTDPGIDFQGILRAVYHMTQGGEVQSGSTITQQFVKNEFLSQSQTVTRKLREIMTSIKISGSGGLSKQQILLGYLNTNYYGRGAYGLQAAAQAYYGKDASQLTLEQGAFIATTVNEPSLYQNVDTDPAAKAQAVSRWHYVLDRMQTDGFMSAAQRAADTDATFPMPKTWQPNQGLTGQTGYLVDLASGYVEDHGNITPQVFDKGGFKVYTTFNKKKMTALTAAVNKTIQSTIPQSQAINKNVQFGGASIDPTTGKILAIYGGAGEDQGYYIDNANATTIQVGSTFKPIVLATAMTNGATLTPGAQPSPITPDSKFDGDNGIKIKDINGNYVPDQNSSDGLLHQQNDSPTKNGYITLRQAMEWSVNTPYVQLGEYTGYDKVKSMAGALGVHDGLAPPSAGFYIGTSTISPIRMASVYGTFDNSGRHYEPYSVTKASQDGVPVAGVGDESPTQAVDPNIANTVTDVLKGVVEHQGGTGYSTLHDLGPDIAGKTGTTDGYKSAWFIGYTPQISTAIMMFKEDPNKKVLESMAGVGGLQKVFGGVIPATVWRDYMTGINANTSTPFPSWTPAGTPGANEVGAPASPTATASASASAKASASASPSAPASNTPSAPVTTPGAPATTCTLLFGCGNGGNNGGGNGGTGGGTSSTPTASASITRGRGGAVPGG